MKKTFLHQVVLNETLNPIEVSEEEAEAFKLKLGDNVDVFTNKDGVRFMSVRKGAALYIPKALKFDRFVAGQIPSSWDPLILGVRLLVAFIMLCLWVVFLVFGFWLVFILILTFEIPEEICRQVDRVTLFTLVSTVEALIASGVTDPYEFYKYVHVSEVGNTIGMELSRFHPG
jgi:fatty acid synthase subunit beta